MSADGENRIKTMMNDGARKQPQSENGGIENLQNDIADENSS